MRLSLLSGICLIVVMFAGCDTSVEHYPPNRVHALVVATSRNAATDLAIDDTSALVEAWFGTPNEPRWPTEHLKANATQSLVSEERITRAAGRVYSDHKNRHFGLYNEHCVKCHGISGGGDGPAALLQNPYPRDFRFGVYKWKMTERLAMPRRDDLRRLVTWGIPGTGMPSFSSMVDDDLEAIIDYVIYLSVRGAFERQLLSDTVDELGYDETRPESELQLIPVKSLDQRKDPFEIAVEVLNEICESWVDAEKQVVPVPDEPANDAESVERGKILFHGESAKCFACHGVDGNGEAILFDYDDWTREFTTRLSITPTDKEAVRPFRAAGALRPRQIQPRKLASGNLRGGKESDALFRRLVTGVPGTPMPALLRRDQSATGGLTDDQIWDLVHYVQSLGEGP